MKSYFSILFLILLLSCSLSDKSSPINSKTLFKHEKIKYNLKENAGEFVVYREKGLKKGTNKFVVKKVIYPPSNNRSKLLEQSISISQLGTLKNKVRILRPMQSQYHVWFDGKKYTSVLNLDTNSKMFILKMTSPEKNWNGIKRIALPDTAGIYCFYSQVMECASVTGFMEKAKRAGYGKMNFYIVWDGYPYFQEQYLHLGNNLISKASIEFDEVKSDGQMKLSLILDNQVLFYVLDKNLRLVKKFWVAQGLSMLESRD